MIIYQWYHNSQKQSQVHNVLILSMEKNKLEIKKAVEARTYKHYLLYHIVHQIQTPVQTSKTAWARGK